MIQDFGRQGKEIEILRICARDNDNRVQENILPILSARSNRLLMKVWKY
jgi:hypothetical protein